MKNNIGIMTFHRSMNYGAILQAYALQQAVLKYASKCLIIDYRSPSIEPASRIIKPGENISLQTIKKAVFRSLKNSKCALFMKRNMRFTQPIASKEKLRQISISFDSIITGSDQVWNKEILEDEDSYFLDFVKDSKKKYSYSASFGDNLSLTNGLKEKYDYLLKDFSVVSIREQYYIKHLSDDLQKRVRVDVDPVFLIDNSHWNKLATKRCIKDKYIFLYIIAEPDKLIDFAHEVSQRYGYKVINSKSSIDFMLHSSPPDFLSWVLNAEMIVTNSFHATAFSIIFNKNFYVEINNGKRINHRIEELLNLFSLKGRDIGDSVSEIDYTLANKTLREFQKRSLSYVESIVK